MANLGDDLTTAPDGSGNSGKRSFGDMLAYSAKIVGALLATMWFIEVLDSFVLDDRLQANGIRPRRTDGLDGIAWSPFLHSGFPHLISNSIPFVVLSALTLTGGVSRYLKASAIIIVVGGLGVWAFALGSNENHIGASGWVFGLLGFLLAAAVLEKKPVTIAVGLVALIFYWSMIFGFVPKDGISWEGHLFGFIGGIVAAKLLVTKMTMAVLDPPDIG